MLEKVDELEAEQEETTLKRRGLSRDSRNKSNLATADGMPKSKRK
jgi:hypothetical protein